MASLEVKSTGSPDETHLRQVRRIGFQPIAITADTPRIGEIRFLATPTRTVQAGIKLFW